MKIRNFLPNLVDCVRDWEKQPGVQEFTERYYAPLAEAVDDVFESGAEMHAVLRDLDWNEYRAETLRLDPRREEIRVKKHLSDVEALFGLELQGEIVLFGSFLTMDGYARFDRGTHRVYLGVDESHGRGRYLDVLETHELAHVARESRPSVWEGFGLDPKMTHADFSENQPVIEHLFGEGFSCAVSELLVPAEDPWNYVYQDRSSLARIRKHAANVNEVIRREVRAGPEGDWGRLYHRTSYQPSQPVFTHYVWAWKWADHLIRSKGRGNARALLETCSREFVEDALEFDLSSALGAGAVE